jgi:hypothetical protein
MVAKKRFSQAQYDKLVTNKARAINSFRKAKVALDKYTKTHTRGY